MHHAWKIALLLMLIVNFSAVASDLDTDLLKAVKEGKTDEVENLLDAGANIDTGDDNHCTPLIIAAQNGDLTIAEILIEKGADVNWSDKSGYTALHHAAQKGYTEIIKLLLDSGAYDKLTHDHLTAEDLAEPNTEAAKLIKKARGVSVSDVDLKLFKAAKNGDRSEVKALLAAGADVNALGDLHETVLMIASEHGHADVVKILLAAGANVKAKNMHGNSALELAAEKGDTETVKILLNRGALIDVEVMLAAAARGHSDVVQLLLDGGVDPNMSRLGWTPLMSAAEFGYTDTVKVLLMGGADVNASSRSGKTALQLAEKNGHTMIIEILNVLAKDDAINKILIGGQHKLLDTHLNEEMIAGLNKRQLRLLRNTFYARHGYSFKSEDLHKYFSQFYWYKPEYANVDNLLTSRDRYFIEYILNLERK